MAGVRLDRQSALRGRLDTTFHHNTKIVELISAEPMPHYVVISSHTCRFGNAWKPVCRDCGYVGPYLSSGYRAEAVGREHSLKTAGVWKAAR